MEIIKVLGTPTREQIREMNPNYSEFKFPQIKAHPWSKVFLKCVCGWKRERGRTFVKVFNVKSLTEVFLIYVW